MKRRCVAIRGIHRHLGVVKMMDLVGPSHDRVSKPFGAVGRATHHIKQVLQGQDRRNYLLPRDDP